MIPLDALWDVYHKYFLSLFPLFIKALNKKICREATQYCLESVTSGNIVSGNNCVYGRIFDRTSILRFILFWHISLEAFLT